MIGSNRNALVVATNMSRGVYRDNFKIVRMNVSKVNGRTRLGVPYYAMLKRELRNADNALELAKDKAHKMGGRMQNVKGVEHFVFLAESVFGLRMKIIEQR